MKLMKNLIIIIAVYFCPAVYSVPIYLDCFVISKENSKLSFEVTLDEDGKTVSQLSSNGFSFNEKGLFFADRISYSKRSEIGGIILTTQYEINRHDLSVVKIVSAVPTSKEALKKIGAVRYSEKGECKLVKTEGRKI